MTGPTPKQAAFANAIVSGASPSEAYRAAYDCGKMSAASVSREANRLLSHPKIAPIVEKGKKEAARTAAWSREMAIERLQGVNAASYARVMRTGSENGFQRADSEAFFGSLDRLCKMVEHERPVEGVPVLVDKAGNVLGRPGVVLVFDRKDEA